MTKYHVNFMGGRRQRSDSGMGYDGAGVEDKVNVPLFEGVPENPDHSFSI